MNKNGKLIAAIGGAVIVVAAIAAAAIKTAGGDLDVVGKDSVKSFEAVLNALPGQVTKDEANAGWSLRAPDGEVRFIWSEDYSKSPLYDVMLEFDAAPFVKAGLDSEKLPDHYAFHDGKITVGTRFGKDQRTDKGESAPLLAYRQIVKHYRSAINYHTAMDHYGVKLGDGNLFEWAKNMETNTVSNENQDKDIVFVLNPDPLLAAGVDPDKVEGWVYAAVPVEENGKNLEVYKFLKPFDLK
ncbi:hypothetical protein [Lacrimispora sp.]|uniref:hypothetical protein n=1 Tax=Lacrimispora sp. TaxID=2719234 RepID=UPI0039917231